MIDQYLSLEELCDRLEDLLQQFTNPQPRKWSAINWQDINPEQLITPCTTFFKSLILLAFRNTDLLEIC